VNFLKFHNFLNIESFIIRIKEKKKWLTHKPRLTQDGLDFSVRIENAGRNGPTHIVTPNDLMASDMIN